MASKPFKGLVGAPKRRRRKANERSDEDRRARMAAIDDATPLKPRAGDLITGAAAQAALRRTERGRR